MNLAVQEWRKDSYVITTDKSALDIELIHRFLTESYWAKGVPKEVVERSIEGSLAFGIYHASRQAGFARAITDFATYAYLADVFVVPAHRGKGLAKWLMECIMSYPGLQNLRRWALVTRDAHDLYGKFGFRGLANPERHMEIAD
jgi:GNAT superfamily N-acetyltransferase